MYMSDIEERRRARQKKVLIIKCIIAFVVLLVLIGIFFVVKGMLGKSKQEPKQDEIPVVSEVTEITATEIETETEEVDTGFVKVGDKQFVSGYEAVTTDKTKSLSEDINSEFVVLIDESTGEIVAQREARTKMYPASMTKILSLLVAADHLESMDQLEDKVTITLESTDFAYVNGLSVVGFLDGEQVPVKDLFYGTILPSGGDAVYALSLYTAGSHEAFVQMMNEKAKELGISETSHFANCAGLFDEENYSTVYDMSMILKAALENDFCREVLSAHTYKTTPTTEHPDGIVISNWFLRRIEDLDSGGEVVGAKTGFVNESRNCCASYQLSDNGKPYICVTGKAQGNRVCIKDHAAIFKNYAQ